MKCNCGKVALRHVRGVGYCGDHQGEAFTAAKSEAKSFDSLARIAQSIDQAANTEPELFADVKFRAPRYFRHFTIQTAAI